MTRLSPAQRTAGTARIVLTAGGPFAARPLWRGATTPIPMATARPLFRGGPLCLPQQSD